MGLGTAGCVPIRGSSCSFRTQCPGSSLGSRRGRCGHPTVAGAAGPAGRQGSQSPPPAAHELAGSLGHPAARYGARCGASQSLSGPGQARAEGICAHLGSRAPERGQAGEAAGRGTRAGLLRQRRRRRARLLRGSSCRCGGGRGGGCGRVAGGGASRGGRRRGRALLAAERELSVQLAGQAAAGARAPQ